MTKAKTVTCDVCKKQVKEVTKCTPGCDMWLCNDCTIFDKTHSTVFDKRHWELLAKSLNIDLDTPLGRMLDEKLKQGLE